MPWSEKKKKLLWITLLLWPHEDEDAHRIRTYTNIDPSITNNKEPNDEEVKAEASFDTMAELLKLAYL